MIKLLLINNNRKKILKKEEETINFIPLGFHCNITFLSEELKIKNHTSVFEWLESRKLQYLTDIINIIKNKIDVNIIKGVDKNIHVLHPDVYTCHYNIEEYKYIFERRAIRFLNAIKTLQLPVSLG